MGLGRTLGIVLKGVGGMLLGPAFSVGCSAIEYLLGQKSGASLLVSVALAGFVDLAFDFADVGFRLDPRPSDDLRRLSVALACELVGAGVDKMVEGYRWERRPSGLYTATTAIVDVSGRDPRLREVWRAGDRTDLPGGEHRGQDCPEWCLHLNGDEWLTNSVLVPHILGGRTLRGSALPGRILRPRRLGSDND